MRLKGISFILAAIVLVGPAAAEEIIYFTNGSEMVVVSHTVEDGMIKVDLGNDSEMAFPLEQVDRIEAADTGMVIDTDSISNRIVSPANTRPVQGSVPSRYADRKRTSAPRTNDVDVDENGVAVWRPFANSKHPGKRKIGAAGNSRVFMPNGDGERRVGTRTVITPGGNSTSRRPTPVGLTPKRASSSPSDKQSKNE